MKLITYDQYDSFGMFSISPFCPVTNDSSVATLGRMCKEILHSPTACLQPQTEFTHCVSSLMADPSRTELDRNKTGKAHLGQPLGFFPAFNSCGQRCLPFILCCLCVHWEVQGGLHTLSSGSRAEEGGQHQQTCELLPSCLPSL